MSCPKCNFSDWRSASLIYSSGISTQSSLTIGSAGGYSDNSLSEKQGIGFGAANTLSHSQTELSKLAAPPEPAQSKLEKLTPIAMIPIVASFAYGWIVGNVFFALLLGFISLLATGGILLIIHPEDKRTEEREEIKRNHSAAMTEYERRVMCLRCGIFYIREDSEVSAQNATMPSAQSTSDA